MAESTAPYHAALPESDSTTLSTDATTAASMWAPSLLVSGPADEAEDSWLCCACMGYNFRWSLRTLVCVNILMWVVTVAMLSLILSFLDRIDGSVRNIDSIARRIEPLLPSETVYNSQDHLRINHTTINMGGGRWTAVYDMVECAVGTT